MLGKKYVKKRFSNDMPTEGQVYEGGSATEYRPRYALLIRAAGKGVDNLRLHHPSRALPRVPSHVACQTDPYG